MENWELTKEEVDHLSEEDLQKYETAVRYKSHDWAWGPYGGWARGNEVLVELGWKEVIINEEHRKFISLIKPDFRTR